MENDLEAIRQRQDLLETYVNALEFRLDIVEDRISLVNAGVGAAARSQTADARSGAQVTGGTPSDVNVASLLRSIVAKQSMHSDDHRTAASEHGRLETGLSSIDAALRRVDGKIQTLIDRREAP